jgi:hypothetical protein
MQLKFLPFLALLGGVVGVPATAPASVPQSIGGVAIGEILDLLGLGLVTQINVFITVCACNTLLHKQDQ